MARPTGVSNFELLDISFFAGRCCAIFHAVFVERFTKAVCTEVFDVKDSAADTNKADMMADSDELRRGSLSQTETTTVLRLKGFCGWPAGSGSVD